MKHAKWIFAGLLASMVTMAGATTQGQQQPSGIEDVLAQLEQLQDANLNIARQMSDMQLGVAADLQAVLDAGLIPEGIQVDILKRLIGNSLTLATIGLAPQPAPESITGPSFAELLERNRAGLRQAASLSGADGDFTAAVRRYEIVQIQVQDMTLALANGWKRYATILGEAQVSGAVVSGSFDPASGSWFLPDALDEAALAALREAAQPPPPVVEPSPPPAAVSASEVTPPATSSGTTVAASAPAPWWLPPNVVEPSVGTDGSALQETAATMPPPSPAPSVTPVDEAAATEAPLSPQPEGWDIALDGRGNLVARSANLAATDDATIRSLGMECNENGLVVFRVTSPAKHEGFDIAIRGAVPEPVTATDNIIAGEEALKLSNALSLAFHADAGRLTLSPFENTAEAAQFTTEGFVEARASVVSGCAALQAAATLGTGGAGIASPVTADTPSPAAPIPAPASERPPPPAAEMAPVAQAETQPPTVEPETAPTVVAAPSPTAPAPVSPPPRKAKPSGPIDLLNEDFVR